MHHHAVDLRRVLAGQHLVALMSANDASCHFIPDHRIDIAEVVQAALDLLIRRVAGLDVLAGIAFRGLEPVNADSFRCSLQAPFRELKYWFSFCSCLRRLNHLPP